MEKAEIAEAQGKRFSFNKKAVKCGWWLWAHATWRHLECPFAVQYAFDMGSYIPSFFLLSSHTIIIGFEIEIKSPIFTDSDRSLIKKFEFKLININFFTPNVRPPHLSLS